jgi:hypothetical protein
MALLVLNGLSLAPIPPASPASHASHPSHALLPPAPDIAAVTCFFNPAGFRSLRRNYDRFRAALEAAAIPLYTVELALGNTTHTIPPPSLSISSLASSPSPSSPPQSLALSQPGDQTPCNNSTIQRFNRCDSHIHHVRSQSVLFAKENLLNLAFRLVPKRYTKLAFVDCDLLWSRPDWLWQASDLLERHAAVQLFQTIHHTDASGRIFRSGPSCAHKHLHHLPGWGAPGGGWAVHRELLQLSGGLYDRMVVGAGDMVHTHLGFIGQFDHPWLAQLNSAFREDVLRWARPIWRYVRGDIACVEAEVRHLWHGHRADRQYQTRSLLLQHAHPETWFRYNAQGVLEWSATVGPEPRQALHRYFTARREDG